MGGWRQILSRGEREGKRKQISKKGDRGRSEKANFIGRRGGQISVKGDREREERLEQDRRRDKEGQRRRRKGRMIRRGQKKRFRCENERAHIW